MQSKLYLLRARKFCKTLLVCHHFQAFYPIERHLGNVNLAHQKVSIYSGFPKRNFQLVHCSNLLFVCVWTDVLASKTVERTDIKLRSYSRHEISVLGEGKVQIASA